VEEVVTIFINHFNAQLTEACRVNPSIPAVEEEEMRVKGKSMISRFVDKHDVLMESVIALLPECVKGEEEERERGWLL
jgi:hypothetical protein